MSERTATLQLRFATRPQDIAQARGQISTLRAELQKLDRERALSQAVKDAADFEAKGGSARVAVARLNAELTKLDAGTDDIRKAAREFDNLRNSAERAAQAASGGASGGGRNFLQRLGTEVRNLPSQQLGGGLSTDVLGKLTATLGGLNPIVLGLTVGIGALAAGLTAVTADATKFTRALIASQREYFDAIQQGTSETIRAQIAAKQVEIDNARARIAENQAIFASLESQVTGVGRAFADALDLGGARALREETQRLEAELFNNEFAVGRLNQALNSNDVAARDAAIALEALQKRQQAFFDSTVDTIIKTQIEADRFDSVAALDERIEALERERALLEQAIATNRLSAEAAERYQARVQEINGAISTFNLISREEVAAREAEIDALKRAEDARKRTAERQAEFAKLSDQARNATAKFNDALTKLETTLSDRLTKAAADRTSALADAEADATKARADAIRGRDDAITEAQRKAQIDRQKAAEDHQKRLTKILNDGQRSQQIAIQNRDAVALEAAQTAQQQQLDEQQDAYREQNKRVDDNLREQTRTIAIRYNEQTRVITERLNEQTRRIIQRYTEQVTAANQAAAQERAILQQNYIQQLSQLQIALQNRLGIEARGAAALLGVQQQYWSQAIQLAQNALQAIAGRGAPTSGVSAAGRLFTTTPRTVVPSGQRAATAFDTGGIVTRTGMAQVHQGEYIINPRRGQGAINFAPTINAGNRGQIVREVNRQLEMLLDQAGL